MALTLHFRNQQIGDGVAVGDVQHAPAVPVARQAGLFQESVGLAGGSRNLEHALSFRVHIKRPSHIDCMSALADIASLQGLQGLLEVQDDGTAVITAEDWWLDWAGPSNLLPAFGGRFTKEYPITFVGETAAMYTPLGA